MNKSIQVKLITISSSCIEFYDFSLLIFVGPVLTQVLFPESEQHVGLLIILGIFSLGYLNRILGGLWFGHKGDTQGRKPSFIQSIALMAISTFLIALLPSFQLAGYTGLVGLLILRIIQGLSLGGEIPGAIVFAAEHSKVNQRGLTTGLIVAGVTSGNILASSLLWLMNSSLSALEVQHWGWRLLFMFGGLLSLLSLSLRLTLTETPAFLNTKSHQATSPIRELLTRHRHKLFKGIMMASLPAVGISTLYEMINYASSLEDKTNTYSIWVFTFVSLGAIVFGKISDIIGRIALIRVSCIAFLLLPISFNSLGTMHLHAAFVPLILGTALISGCYIACLTELMPTNIRFTGIATCHNFAFAFFGGLTPLLLESLIQNNHVSALAFIPAIVAVPLFITSFYWTDKYNLSLMDGDI